MGVTLEQIARLTVEARVVGVDELTRELKDLSDANREAAASGQALATSTESSARSMLSSSRQFDAMRYRLDPLAKAQNELERGQRLVQRAFNDGTKTASEAAEMLVLLQQRHDNTVASIKAAQAANTAQTAALKASGAAYAEHAGKVELNRTQMVMMLAAAKHSAESLASGMPAQTIFMQQGLEFADALNMGSGGAMASLRALGSSLMGLLTPSALVTGALVGMGAAAAYSVYSWTSATSQIDASLQGLGRRAGLTAGQLQGVALSGARSAGLSSLQGMEMAGQFARSGLNGGDIEGAIDTANRFARVTGTDMTAATGTLAHALADPVKGFNELNSVLGFADERTRVLITTMAQSGDILGAQHALLSAVSNDLKNAADHSSALASAYEWIKRSLSNAGAGIGSTADKIFGFESLEQQMDGLLSRKRGLEAEFKNMNGPAVPKDALGNAFGSGETRREIELNDAAIRSLQKKIDRANDEAQAKSIDIRQRENSVLAASDVYSVNPDIERRRQLVAERKRLESAVSNPYFQNIPGIDQSNILRTLNAVKVAEEGLLPIRDRLQAASDLDLKAIAARTVEERAAVAAERELLSLRSGVVDPDIQLRAKAKSDAVYAQSVRDAEDRLRSARDTSELAGLPSYRRSQMEIEQRYRRQAELDAKSPDALSRDRATRDAELAALQKSSISGPIEEANRALDSQNRMLAVNAATFGQTTGAVTAARTQMEMYNRYMEAGIPITDAMRASVEAYARAMGQSAQAAEDLEKRQRLVIAGMDDIRSTSTNVFSQLLHGKSFADIGRTLADHAIDKGANFLTGSLFGEQGKPGGGLFGDSLGKMFGVGAMTVGTQTVTAGVVNIGGPGLGGLGGVPGVGANAGTTYSSTPLPDLAGKAFATGYSPQTAGDRIEGGLASSRAGLDGQSMVRTLDDYRLGRSNYVTLAGNPDFYGKSYTMPSVDYVSGGQKYHLDNVPGYVHDTGSAFRTAPEGRFDVALGRDLSFAERNQSMSGIQFQPATQALEQFQATTQTATTNLGGFGTGLGQMASQLVGGIGKGGAATGGGLGGLLGSVFHLFGFRTGGVFGGGAPMAFADGTVIGGATLFPMAGGRTGLMGEAGPEAIMPLSRGADGKLGVRAAISAAAAAQVHQTSVRQTVSIGGHTIIVQGNADENALDQMRSELDRRDAIMRQWVQKSSINTYSNQSKLKG